MTGVDAGVNLYAGRTNEGRFFLQKKPRRILRFGGLQNEDTNNGITISHVVGDNGASHMTGFSLSDATVPVNGTVPDISTAAEPPAPPRMTPEAARQAEAGALAGQDESLRQRLADVEKRGAVDAGETAARTEDGLAGVPGSEARKK